MATAFHETSTVTSKHQTTVPKVVRQALGIGKGDQLEYLMEDGKIVLKRHEETSDESAVDAFLAFLSSDIKRRPRAVAALSKEQAEELRALTVGIEVDLDGDFSDVAPL